MKRAISALVRKSFTDKPKESNYTETRLSEVNLRMKIKILIRAGATRTSRSKSGAVGVGIWVWPTQWMGIEEPLPRVMEEKG